MCFKEKSVFRALRLQLNSHQVQRDVTLRILTVGGIVKEETVVKSKRPH